MDPVVSKSRTKKAKTRDKRSARSPSRGATSPSVGRIELLAVVLLWILSVFLLGVEGTVAGDFSPDRLVPLAGKAAFLLVGLLASGLYLKLVGPTAQRKYSQILVLCSVAMASLILVKLHLYVAARTGLLSHDIVPFLLPTVIAPLLATILLDGKSAIAVGGWTSLAVTMLAGGSYPLFINGMVATTLVAATAEHVRTRSKVVRIGLLAGVAQIACLFGPTAMHWQEATVAVVLSQAAACLVGGFIAGILALIILPAFETLFKITTDISLLELSDLSHPLLQKLAMQAPGTYHHSLVVASLAQSAAEEIGANSLLARVGAYFHDIGKLTKPEFFVENIAAQTNPHDGLPPSMSTLIITSHVKEGLSLAMLHKLPEPIKNIICEHHGTGLLSYFHHKARTQLEFELTASNEKHSASDTVPESSFRYSGPRPSSKESAIIALADPVEAASRAMEKTSPGHIEELVNELVNARIEDGQLDECGLSLNELAHIKSSFVFSLTNILHGRIPYPKNEDRDKQPAKNSQGERAKNRQPDTAPDA